jgi:hypothetical protein
MCRRVCGSGVGVWDGGSRGGLVGMGTREVVIQHP